MTAKELHDKIMSSSYEDGLKAIQQYAAEVSRESNKKIALDFAFEILGHNDYTNSNQMVIHDIQTTTIIMYNNLFPDEKIKAILRKKFTRWIKEQEEQ